MVHSALAVAIDAAGGSSPFRAAVGISTRTLATWRKQGVPDTRWQAVARASAGAVSVSDLALERAAAAANSPETEAA